MTDGDALLAAVLAAPKDDAPRLIYADWLDDHDEPDVAACFRLPRRRWVKSWGSFLCDHLWDREAYQWGPKCALEWRYCRKCGKGTPREFWPGVRPLTEAEMVERLLNRARGDRHETQRILEAVRQWLDEGPPAR